MKFHEQVLLNIANNERCFIADIGIEGDSSLSHGDSESYDLTFQEAIEYIEDSYPYYLRKYGKDGEILASVCDDWGEPIVVYNGKKWSVW